MSDNATNNNANTQDPAATPSDQVTLSKEQYTEMMSAMSSMRQQLSDLSSKVPAPVANDSDDDASDTDIDYSKLSPKEAMELITDNVANRVSKPLMQMVMTLVVKEEVRECRDQHKDFDAYKEDISKLALAKPSLSIKEAYKIVKSDNPEKGQKFLEGLKAKNTSDTPTTKPKPLPSQRPGVTTSTTAETSKLSVREAAAKAAADILGE